METTETTTTPTTTPKRWPWSVAVVAVLLVSGCAADTAAEIEPTTEPEPAAETSEPAPEPEPEPEPVKEEATPWRLAEYDLDVEWSDSGLTIEIGQLVVVDREIWRTHNRDEDFWLEDDTVTVFALEVSVTNATGGDIELFPAQSTLVIGPDQLESNFMFDDFPSPLRDGVTVEGVIAFETEHEAARFEDVTEIRWFLAGAFDADTWDDVTGDVDLTITL